MSSDSQTIETLVSAFNSQLTDSKRNKLIGLKEGEIPRFRLYHAGFSICSQKVRAVLAETGTPYASHELSILNSRGIYSEELTPAENYTPSYVKLRLLGGKSLGKDLASGYSARSSVETEGFDACVVPTLVDHGKGRVIVDSKMICQYLDDESPGPVRLIPANPALKRAVLEQISIVDTAPQPGLLYGAHPDDDQRPEFIKKAMASSYELKIEALESLLEANRDDPELVAAYSAKLSKERAAMKTLANSDRVVAIRNEAQDMIDVFDRTLSAAEGPWLVGSDFTMADIVWGINLYRLQWLGMASLWAKLPRVEEYAQRVYQRPSIWDAVINFPSPMPASPHTQGIPVPEWAA